MILSKQLVDALDMNCSWYKTAIPKVWSKKTWGSPGPFQEVLKIRTIFIIVFHLIVL